jgi:hypothetical protein
MKFNKAKIVIINLMLAVAVLAITTFDVKTNSSSRTGQLQAGCSCHSGGGGTTNLTLTSSKGSWTVNTGEKITITFGISNSSQSSCGMNGGVKANSDGSGNNIGTLSSPSSNAQIQGGELTHNGEQTLSGTTNFTVEWTAPTTAGTYYVVFAGNACDNTGGTGGDTPARITQAITVQAQASIALNAPNGGQNLCPGGTANITWTASQVANVKIELSSDGGNTFPTTLAASVPATPASYAWNIPANQAQGNQYRIRVSDAANANLRDDSDANFSVVGTTTITTQPEATKTFCTGGNGSIFVVASGSGLSYQWKYNGFDLPGATSATLSVTSVTAQMAGSYTCQVTGPCNNVTSTACVVTVKQGPTIATQPVNTTACIGKLTGFSVAATGDDLNYQWQKNNVDIAGANTATYTIATVSAGDAGTYRCRVSATGCLTSAISNPATLSISNPTQFTAQPQGGSVCEGGNITLSSVVTGDVLSYQWFKNGVAFGSSAESSATLNLVNVTALDAGTYVLVARSLCEPSATSTAVKVDINLKPVIATQPVQVNTVAGGSAVFTVAASGTQTNTYQWQKGTENIANATSATLTLTNVKVSDEGQYRCVVTNTCGSKNSEYAQLRVSNVVEGILTLGTPKTLDETATYGTETTIIVKDFIKNTGNADLTINEITTSGGKESATVSAVLPVVVKPGSSFDFGIKYNPKEIGVDEFDLTVKSGTITKTSKLGIASRLSATPITLSSNTITLTSGDGKKVEQTVDLILDISKYPFAVESKSVQLNKTQFMADTAKVRSTPNVPGKLKITYTPDKVDEFVFGFVTVVYDFMPPLPIGVVGQYVLASVELNDNLVANAKVIPNPTSDEMQITFDNPSGLTFDVVIINTNGEEVANFSGVTNGITWNTRMLNGSLAPSGSYAALIKTQKEVKVVKLQITR